jgi:hypothetical protein
MGRKGATRVRPIHQPNPALCAPPVLTHHHRHPAWRALLPLKGNRMTFRLLAVLARFPLAQFPLVLFPLAVLAEVTPNEVTCEPHGQLLGEMAAKGSVITMAEVVQDGSNRRLEAYYQADQCIWTLVIVDSPDGKVTPQSRTCLLGEGDPGVCIPKAR